MSNDFLPTMGKSEGENKEKPGGERCIQENKISDLNIRMGQHGRTETTKHPIYRDAWLKSFFFWVLNTCGILDNLLNPRDSAWSALKD